MNRFERDGLLANSAGDAVKAVLVVAVALVLFAGGSIRGAAAEMESGIGKDLISAVGEPTEWIAERLPLDEAQTELTSALSPDDELGGGGFDATATNIGGAGAAAPPVTAQAFDPAAIGAPVPDKRELETLLVTGDSLATPLDTELARRLTPEGIEVVRDPQLGTGISNTAVGDWGELSAAQVAREAPDAVVIFIGANEGFSIPVPGGEEVECCDTEYAAAYANRVRQVMDTFRQDGEAKVYWLTVMAPRDADGQRVARLVNAAVEVAAQPWRSQVRVIDTVAIFTPDGRYTDSIEIDGEETIVRESDGIHLNEAGSGLAADEVLERIDQDFTR